MRLDVVAEEVRPGRLDPSFFSGRVRGDDGEVLAMAQLGSDRILVGGEFESIHDIDVGKLGSAPFRWQARSRVPKDRGSR